MDDHLERRLAAAGLGDDVDPRAVAQGDVGDEDDRRLGKALHADPRLTEGGRLGDDAEVSGALEEALDPDARERVGINDEDRADLLGQCQSRMWLRMVGVTEEPS